MAVSTYYVHKEPVFDKKRSLFGNEFLFRKHASSGNGMGWPVLSVDEEVVSALSSEGGFESLVGSKPVFLSLDVAAVKGHALAFLPRDSIFQVPVHRKGKGRRPWDHRRGCP